MMCAKKFSVCIPNFNYSNYIESTLASILAQDSTIPEICVADNASTDQSVSIVRSLTHAPVKLRLNNWNVGFAGNLDKAAAMASGDFMIMLSSDDVMMPGALATYGRLADALGDKANSSVWAAPAEIIDSDGRAIGSFAADPKFWAAAEIDRPLSDAVGAPVRHLPAPVLLRRSLELLRTPFPFLSTCYPRALYEAVEGYAGKGLINPDKWFAWKLLSVATDAYMVERELFGYRVHVSNQNAQQAASGALKHLVDQYTATFDLGETVLARAGMSKAMLAAAFVEQDIALRGFDAVAEGNRHLARRHLRFGLATYPALMRRNAKVWALGMLLALGPLGSFVAKLLKPTLKTRWDRRAIADAPAGNAGMSVQ